MTNPNAVAPWIVPRIQEFGSRPAMVWNGQESSYSELLAKSMLWTERLNAQGATAGSAVAFRGDFSPEAVSLLFALLRGAHIAVPLAAATPDEIDRRIATSCASLLVDPQTGEMSSVPHSDHALLERLRARGRAGLIIFSSGSTGVSKGSLLDLELLLENFREPRKALRTLTFLLLDHIGGINTLFATLASGGMAVVAPTRDPESVCSTIQQHKVQVLPTSPTFLRLMLMSEAPKRFDLSSLELITYGTEPMHQATLEALHKELPHVRFKQTYGLTELGIFRTQSRSDGSLWVKIGGDGVSWKVIDGVLWIRSKNAMLGYLNAEQPFAEDGWYNTGDEVEVDGDYLLIKGRKTEIINVGGEKVYPAEVESILLRLDNVADATVVGRKNAVTGQVVIAHVNLRAPEDAAAFETRARAYCKAHLAPYKVPALIQVSDAPSFEARFKKMRNNIDRKTP